jgi:hypothetical protein
MANPAAAGLLGRDLVGQTLPASDPDGYERFGTQHLDGSPYPTQMKGCGWRRWPTGTRP